MVFVTNIIQRVVLWKYFFIFGGRLSSAVLRLYDYHDFPSSTPHITFLMLIICRCFIYLLLFLSLYRKRFRLLKARPEIESLNSGGNLIKRRLSLVYLGVCMCVFFFQPTSTRSPIYKRLWINRGGWMPSDVLQKLLCLATKFNEKYVQRVYLRSRCIDKHKLRRVLF